MIDLLIATAIAPHAALVTIPPPPMAITTNVPPGQKASQQSMVMLMPVSGNCADGALDISAIQKPAVQLLWLPNGPVEPPVTLNFRIDENGRALGIKRDPAGYGTFPDLSPSLAASRFASGNPRSGCKLTYVPQRTSITDANVDDLIAYSIFPALRPPKALFERLSPDGSNCYPQRPPVLLQAYPDFDKISASPGRIDWAMVKFDVDATGKPVAIGIRASTGNTALDKASMAAIAKSRFAKGSKRGCLYPYWRSADPIAAPESPDTAAHRGGEGKCPTTVEWKSKPALVYPDNFRRRGIEGWAIVAFDVAPWGATGNVKLIAAEPSADFGDAALSIVSRATVASSGQGYSGCFEKVRYVMGEKRSNDEPATD